MSKSLEQGFSMKIDTKLHYYAAYGDLKGVKDQLDRGVNVNIRGHQGYTPLHRAVTGGHIDIVRELLVRKANTNETANPDINVTPLAIATYRGFCEIVKVLVASGANPNCRTDLQNTPLHIAYKEGHTDIVEALILGGSDQSARNVFGETPIDIAKTVYHR